VGLATVYSFYLLLWSSDISKRKWFTFIVKVKKKKQLIILFISEYSYEALARHGMGSKASTAVKCIIIIDSFGTLSAYLIVVADAARVFFSIFLEEGNILLDKRILILLSLVSPVNPTVRNWSTTFLWLDSDSTVVFTAQHRGPRIHFAAVPITAGIFVNFANHFLGHTRRRRRCIAIQK